ncbi:zf-TFIIB domain-containing protein [Marinicella sp. W31]|uniref:TFIIB-type zinc ribbon-containing protein n=1 Tax=Marinicella sp. W31 TaxID=3023713 RepID=UPI0037573D1E
MKCPSHSVDLVPSHAEEAFGWYCSKCSGLFLTQKEIQAFKYNYQTDILEYLSLVTPQKISNRCCPSCSKSMEMKMLAEVMLDVCAHCQGVWFDRNEVSKIIDDSGDREIPTNMADFFGGWLG